MTETVQKSKHSSHEALMRYARTLKFGDIHHRIDHASGLQAIIAIHNTQRGPALGGCRLYPYQSYAQALKDVLLLASMMTIKNAACELNHGGAKAVIIQPKGHFDRKKLFNAFGQFVNDLQGTYITAMDVGTTSQDMNDIAECTPHVAGAHHDNPLLGDPSPYTAKGIFRSIQAAVMAKHGRESLQGLSIALQGIGKVGYHLAKQLHQAGVKVTACDINPTLTKQLAQEIGATIVAVDDIYQQPCDIFSPCALGGTLNAASISIIKAGIIAGCANNQLAHRSIADTLHQRGILYLPDFIVNAGGVIQAASVHDYQDLDIANKKIDGLYERLLSIIRHAQQQHISTVTAANHIAYQNLSTKEVV